MAVALVLLAWLVATQLIVIVCMALGARRLERSRDFLVKRLAEQEELTEALMDCAADDLSRRTS